MDILVALQRLLDETPAHQHLTAPLKRKVLVEVIAEISNLRKEVAELQTVTVDAQSRTGTNQTL